MESPKGSIKGLNLKVQSNHPDFDSGIAVIFNTVLAYSNDFEIEVYEGQDDETLDMTMSDDEEIEPMIDSTQHTGIILPPPKE